MKGERLVAAGTLVLLPTLVWFLAIRPALRRIAALQGRVAAVQAAGWPLAVVTPLGPEERRLLQDPAAAWRTRIPVAADDGERLALADRVVGELGTALRAQGVRLVALRALLDPVQADFSLDPGQVRALRPEPRAPAGTPEETLRGWVLDLEIAGPTRELFRALAASARTGTLLEPVALRWEAADGAGRQHLLLRCYYLSP